MWCTWGQNKRYSIWPCSGDFFSKSEPRHLKSKVQRLHGVWSIMNSRRQQYNTCCMSVSRPKSSCQINTPLEVLSSPGARHCGRRSPSWESSSFVLIELPSRAEHLTWRGTVQRCHGDEGLEMSCTKLISLFCREISVTITSDRFTSCMSRVKACEYIVNHELSKSWCSLRPICNLQQAHCSTQMRARLSIIAWSYSSARCLSAGILSIGQLSFMVFDWTQVWMATSLNADTHNKERSPWQLRTFSVSYIRASDWEP